jgi:succinoglycan biosynthesis transport protein ExoP
VTNQNSEDILKELRLRDYLRIARRRIWWIVLITSATFIIATVAARRLPNVYRSETVILVDPQQVPSTYVASTVSTSIMDRLSTIRQEVLSPTRLQQLAKKLDLYPELRAQGKGDSIIGKMQKSTSIEVIDAGGQRRSAFRIAYTSRNPSEAAVVANQLAAAFIEDNLKTREEQFAGTQEFLESELNDTKKQLEQKEAEMGRLKSEHVMDLPESKDYHLQSLSSLRIQLQESQDRVNRDQQQKVYLQSLLLNSTPTVDLDAEGNGTQSGRAQGQTQKLETQLSAMRSRYGPNYPEVRKLQDQISALKAKEATEEQGAPIVEKPVLRAPRNPVLEAQITKIDQEIDEQTKLQPQLQQQIDFHASKLEQEPVFEQQVAGSMRDYDTLRQHYNQLLDKKLSAEMATQLESRQKGERFEILDRAQVPSHPSGPNRLLFSLAGLFGGLLGGIGLAIFAELSDNSVRNERDAADIFGMNVLAGIPYVVTQHQLRRNRFRLAGAFVAIVFGSVAMGVVFGYLGQKFL